MLLQVCSERTFLRSELDDKTNDASHLEEALKKQEFDVNDQAQEQSIVPVEQSSNKGNYDNAPKVCSHT